MQGHEKYWLLEQECGAKIEEFGGDKNKWHVHGG